MSFRFYRRIPIFPGVWLNISKTGFSVTIGRRGARLTLGRTGATGSVGLPGTGASYRKHASYKGVKDKVCIGDPQSEKAPPKKSAFSDFK